MSIMHSEWTGRLKHWIRTLKDDFYQPLGEISWEMFRTMEQLSPEEAEKQAFTPVSAGQVWGEKYEYGWLRADVELPAEAEGERIVLNLKPQGESTVFVNHQAFGNYRADWVREPHHFMVDNFLTTKGKPGDRYHLLVEVYAGHFYPEAPTGGCATGPVLPGSYEDPATEGKRRTLGVSTYGIWNEDAYQLYMDVDTLYQLLQILDEDSLRASRIAEALEQFTLMVDFEQSREKRITSYRQAREALKPVMEARNGSTMPVFYCIGNSHLDLAWLWPMAETYRKTARTFAAQLRLIDEYPDYKYIQSQPASYEMCRKYYPELFERILKAIKKGQWIADGAMWVEPDTNMASGEALIRQLVHGIRYYKEVLGVESKTLWLPDTFGYTGALPQILKDCGVDYLVTQKIFWSYNEGDKFPYHYFTWEGIDGSKVTSFLPTSYTYYTTPTEANQVWKNRTQKRDLSAFLFPYGYGDGGGGPVRDYIEYVERQHDLEGSVKMKHVSPREFFETLEEEEGGPKNTYRGELYFSAHRGTYTSQAQIKKNNRKAELSLRELEVWGSLVSALEKGTYPLDQADAWWKETLLHQFHDILPGSGIAEIYREAEQRVGHVITDSTEEAGRQRALLVEEGTDTILFNSLGFERTAVVEDAVVKVPAAGLIPLSRAKKDYVPARATRTDEGVVMENSQLRALISEEGEILSFRLQGSDREFAAGRMNHFRLFKDVPRLFDAWDIDSNYELQEVEGLKDAKLTILSGEGTRAVIRLEGRISESELCQEIVLEAESRRIEFRTRIDWKELHRLLKASFPVNVYTDEVINEMQFGYVRRPVHRSRLYDKDRFEVCNHHYSALADGSHGAAVLNDCKYGMSANGNALELTLLRAPAAPEMRADNRVHSFTYAFTAFEGPFEASDVVRQGWELNVPVQTAVGSADGFSAFQVQSDMDSAILDTIKPAEDGSRDLVLRVYDSKKAAGRVTLQTPLPVIRAWICNMLEEKREEIPVREGRVSFDIRDFGIVTLRLSFDD